MLYDERSNGVVGSVNLKLSKGDDLSLDVEIGSLTGSMGGGPGT